MLKCLKHLCYCATIYQALHELKFLLLVILRWLIPNLVCCFISILGLTGLFINVVATHICCWVKFSLSFEKPFNWSGMCDLDGVTERDRSRFIYLFIYLSFLLLLLLSTSTIIFVNILSIYITTLLFFVFIDLIVVIVIIILASSLWFRFYALL